MNLSHYIKEIRKGGRRCFDVKQLMIDQGLSKNAALNAIARLKKQGDLISPARSLYVIVPPERQRYGCIAPEELMPLVMEYWGTNYYAALLTAGLFHGATHQKPARFQVISDRRIKHPSTFGEVEIDYFYKKFISELPTQDFVVNTGYLKVATPELVALDLLEYPDHAGGLNHIATVLSELIDALNPIKLIELANHTNTQCQLQRIGYILEQVDMMNEKQASTVTDCIADYVKANRPNYLPIAPEISKVGYPRCKKWRIIENADIQGDL